ncbi:MAG: DUF4258 domain-containing protein [Bryobacterales bacterium]|nr:DUF4258 domain-containing protein [Bryobacterales bacterium]
MENPGGLFGQPALTTNYTYDAADRLTTVNQGEQQRSYGYDGLGRLTCASNPESRTGGNACPGSESGVDRYVYDLAGNLLSKTDARGWAVQYSLHDVLNRPGQKQGTSLPLTRYCYDGMTYSGGNCVGVEGGYNRGRLTGMGSAAMSAGGLPESPLIVRQWTYDQRGLPLTSSQLTSGTTFTFAYTHNRDAALVSQTYPSGRVVQYSHDVAGRVNSVAGFANEFGYHAAGALRQMRAGKTRCETSEVNDRLQVTAMRLGRPNGSCASVVDVEWQIGLAYGGANNGNVLQQTITARLPWWPPPPDPQPAPLQLVQNYAYDGLNRLNFVSESVLSGGSGGGAWWRTWNHDQWGNGWIPTLDGGALDGATATAASQYNTTKNQQVQTAGGLPIQYDAAGNMTAHPVLGGTMLYNAEQKLVRRHHAGVTADFAYDGEGRRVRKIDGGVWTTYVYDAYGKLAAEYTQGTPAVLGTRYVTVDWLGSTRATTDAAGRVVSRRDYFPYGEAIAGTNVYGNRHLVPSYAAAQGLSQMFTGKEREGQTGLDYFGARYFSGAQGRFTSADPENANAMVSDPQSWNMYAYGRNNPLSYVDPDGLAYRVCQVGQNGKEANCTTQKSELSDKQFEQFKKDNKGSLTFAGGKVYAVNEDGSRGAQTGTYKQTDVDIDNPAFGAVAQGIRAASPATDPRFIAGFYGASALGGLALYGGGAFAGGQLTTLGLQTSAATEGSTALAGTLNFSKHAVQRMAERGFTRDMIQVTIKNGTRYWDPKNGTFNYVLRGGFASGKNALVGVNPVTNTVTTVIKGGGIPARLIPF